MIIRIGAALRLFVVATNICNLITITAAGPRKIKNTTSNHPLQSSLIRSVYLKNKVNSVNVSKTKTDVFIATVLTFEEFLLKFTKIYKLFM